MKAKHLIWIIGAVFAVATVAAGVAFFVYRFFGTKEPGAKNYIECECDPEYT